MFIQVIAFETADGTFDIHYSSRLGGDPLSLLPYVEATRQQGLNTRLLDVKPSEPLNHLTDVTPFTNTAMSESTPFSDALISPDPVETNVSENEIDSHVPFDATSALYVVSPDQVRVFAPQWIFTDVIAPLMHGVHMVVWRRGEEPDDFSPAVTTQPTDVDPLYDIRGDAYMEYANAPRTPQHDIIRDYHAFPYTVTRFDSSPTPEDKGYWMQDDDYTIAVAITPEFVDIVSKFEEGDYFNEGVHVEHTVDWEKLATDDELIDEWVSQYWDVNRDTNQQRMYGGTHLTVAAQQGRQGAGEVIDQMTNLLFAIVQRSGSTTDADNRVHAFSEKHTKSLEALRDKLRRDAGDEWKTDPDPFDAKERS